MTHSTRHDELRALVQDAVFKYTTLQREELRRKNPGLSDEELDMLQPVVEEYDPVVELSLIAADRRHDPSLRRQANADAAQYLRPKLKSVEMMTDPRLLEQNSQKMQLADKMLDILEAMAAAKASRS